MKNNPTTPNKSPQFMGTVSMVIIVLLLIGTIVCIYLARNESSAWSWWYVLPLVVLLFILLSKANLPISKFAGTGKVIGKLSSKSILWVIGCVVVVGIIIWWIYSPVRTITAQPVKPLVNRPTPAMEFDTIPKDANENPLHPISFGTTYHITKGRKSLPFIIDNEHVYTFILADDEHIVLYNTLIPSKTYEQTGTKSTGVVQPLPNGIYKVWADNGDIHLKVSSKKI